jgi:hypothetical protein
VLAFATVAYTCAQWILARNIGGSTVFSASRKRDLEDFNLVYQQLGSDLKHTCQAEPASTFFFSDQDVLLPYLPTQRESLFGCKAVLELAPTVIPAKQWQSCNVIGVWEFTQGIGHPNPWAFDPIHAEKFGPYVERRWQTPDGQTGFILYQHTCAASEKP